MIQQIEINLAVHSRGFHLITEEILRQIELPDAGIMNVFIKHTSASLTINENFDSTVLDDFETVFNLMVPEDMPYYTHTVEGSDDMPAHIKSSLTDSSINIPISEGRLNLGEWQGIYLCEFRNKARSRKLVITIYS